MSNKQNPHPMNKLLQELSTTLFCGRPIPMGPSYHVRVMDTMISKGWEFSLFHTEGEWRAMFYRPGDEMRDDHVKKHYMIEAICEAALNAILDEQQRSKNCMSNYYETAINDVEKGDAVFTNFSEKYKQEWIISIDPAIENLYRGEFDKHFGTNPITQILDSQNQINESLKACDHSWKHYQGLMESFEYCGKCGKKNV